MFCLAQFVQEQTNFFGDILDKRPSQLYKPNPLMLVIDDKLPLEGKINALLNSKLTSQICWALDNICKLKIKVPDALVQRIPSFLKNSESSKIELSAVYATYSLLKRSPQEYTPIFLQTILLRIRSVPAIEYTMCIEIMVKVLTLSQIETIIMPLIDTLYGQSDVFQHIATQIILVIPNEKLMKITSKNSNNDSSTTSTNNNNSVFTTEYLFGKMDKSEVIISEYLVRICLKFANEFGENWINNEIPEFLLKKDTTKKAIRSGIASYFIHFIDKIRISTLYTQILAIFSWAAEEDEISIHLLQNCEKISNSRFIDLSKKLLPLCQKITNVDIKVKIPSLLCEKSIILLNGQLETAITSVFKSFETDKNPKIRHSFISKLDELHKSVDKSSLKLYLLNYYLSLFQHETDKNCREQLVNEYLLVTLIECIENNTIMSQIVSLMESFKDRWRFFTRILSAIQKFPKEKVAPSLKPIMLMIENAVKINPQALEKSVISFYFYVIHKRFDSTIRMNDLMKYLSSAYASSNQYQLRVLYLKLAIALIDEFVDNSKKENNNSQFYYEFVYKEVEEKYINEKVMFVKSQLLDFLISLWTKFDEKLKIHRGVDSLLLICMKDNDPLVIEKAKKVREEIPVPKDILATPTRSESTGKMASKANLPSSSSNNNINKGNNSANNNNSNNNRNSYHQKLNVPVPTGTSSGNPTQRTSVRSQRIPVRPTTANAPVGRSQSNGSLKNIK